MSVDYSAKYGFGFIITEEDLHNLGPEKRDKMIDSEFFHCIDDYSERKKDTPYFFGIIIKSADPGEYCLVPTFDVFKPGELNRMSSEFRTYGDLFYKYHNGPRHYMFCSII